MYHRTSSTKEQKQNYANFDFGSNTAVIILKLQFLLLKKIQVFNSFQLKRKLLN